ncbi:MAG: iron-containing redox enzyme family protein, partial [Novosphingobium sp.]
MASQWRVEPGSAQSQFLAEAFQQRIAHWNHERLAPGLPDAAWSDELGRELAMRRLEGGFVEELRAGIAERAAEAPTDPDGFLRWFEALEANGPGQHDRLFDWLAEEATLDQLRWFLRQEAAGEAGFDDLVALTQVKLPDRAKLELARNYWDEMGRGNPKAMHGPMLRFLTEALELEP